MSSCLTAWQSAGSAAKGGVLPVAGPGWLHLLAAKGRTMQRCAASLAGESRQRTASVLRSMAKGLRRPDNVPPLKSLGQAVGLLRKMYQPCEHVPLELPDRAVIHAATVWDRGDGAMLALNPHSVAAPRSALGSFSVAAARARAGSVLTQAEVRPVPTTTRFPGVSLRDCSVLTGHRLGPARHQRAVIRIPFFLLEITLFWGTFYILSAPQIPTILPGTMRFRLVGAIFRPTLGLF